MRHPTFAGPIAFVACLVAMASVAPPSTVGGPDALPSSGGGGRSLADRVDVPRDTRQLVTVTSRGWGQQRATLRAWRRTSDGWSAVGDPARVRLGYGGWVAADNRVQSTGTTPAGRFPLPSAFGRLRDPGSDLRYRRFDGDDWWPYDPNDPATYNVYQRHRSARADWRPAHAERLADYGRQYAYAVVVGFNPARGVHYSTRHRQWIADRPADTKRGGGIFVHVHGDGATAGCVSMTRAKMRWLLRWLRPGAEPRIVMGPRRYVTRL